MAAIDKILEMRRALPKESKEMITETQDNHVIEIVDKVDDVLEGYTNQDIMSALITLMIWLIADIHLNTNEELEVDTMINQIHNALSDGVPLQLSKLKETSN